MIYSIAGKLAAKNQQFAVIEAGGIGFKIFVPLSASRKLPKIGSKTKLFCYLHQHREGAELYGFLTEKELEIFELFNAVNGVGPKAALKILGLSDVDRILNAISQKRSDLLVKAAGVGEKKAERIILEMRDKIKNQNSGNLTELAENDAEIESALKNLGYKKSEIGEALKQIPAKIAKKEERLKTALKILNFRR